MEGRGYSGLAVPQREESVTIAVRKHGNTHQGWWLEDELVPMPHKQEAERMISNCTQSPSPVTYFLSPLLLFQRTQILSQHLFDGSQSPVTPIPGNPMAAFCLQVYQACTWYKSFRNGKVESDS